MKDNLSIQEQLIRKIESLRHRIGEMEKSESKNKEEGHSLNKAREELEEQLVRRSVELSRINVDLQDEIKERKMAQAETIALKKQMEFVLGVTKTGLDIIDSDYNMVYIDPAWEKVYGDYRGKKCYQYFMGRKNVCPHCGVTKSLETKKPVVTEEFLAKEGNRPIQVTTIPFQDEHSNWLVAEVNVDITESKKAQERIKVFSDAIASAFDCFLLTDIKGNITYANPSACATFGYTPEEFLKLNIAELDADPKFAKKVRQEVSTNGKWNGEVTNIRKNKEKFHSLLSAFIVKDESGSPKGTMGILRDITGRKKAEEVVKEYASRLETQKQALEQKNVALRELIEHTDREKIKLKRISPSI
ncbi:MAG: PAS domain-containing protein [Candidatus Omnitrophica bacterium]|nr:PAS domain-containing protein [Candidatus Omnitrophota bacterium]